MASPVGDVHVFERGEGGLHLDAITRVGIADNTGSVRLSCRRRAGHDVLRKRRRSPGRRAIQVEIFYGAVLAVGMEHGDARDAVFTQLTKRCQGVAVAPASANAFQYLSVSLELDI